MGKLLLDYPDEPEAITSILERVRGRDVRRWARAGIWRGNDAGFEDGGGAMSQSLDGRKGKEMDYPYSLQKEYTPDNTLILAQCDSC